MGNAFSGFEFAGDRCSYAGLGNILDQLGRPDREGMSQLDDVDEAYVPLTTLDTAHVVPMEIGQFCKFLLRELPSKTKLA